MKHFDFLKECLRGHTFYSQPKKFNRHCPKQDDKHKARTEDTLTTHPQINILGL